MANMIYTFGEILSQTALWILNLQYLLQLLSHLVSQKKEKNRAVCWIKREMILWFQTISRANNKNHFFQCLWCCLVTEHTQLSSQAPGACRQLSWVFQTHAENKHLWQSWEEHTNCSRAQPPHFMYHFMTPSHTEPPVCIWLPPPS